MTDTAKPNALDTDTRSSRDRVFESAAGLFAVLSTPVRLKIVGAVCEQERSFTELVALIGIAPSDISEHLAALCRSGVFATRGEGEQIRYRVQSEYVIALCQALCTQASAAPSPDPISNAKDTS